MELDQKIAGLVFTAKKGAVILLNKWDLVDKNILSVKDIEKQVYQKLWFMRYAPVLTISAQSKQRVTKLFSLVDEILDESSRRIDTHVLNEFLINAVKTQPPPLYRGKMVKIHYVTQIKTNPPGFVLFATYKDGIKEQYIKYVESRLRACFSFKGVPVEFYVRQKQRQ